MWKRKQHILNNEKLLIVPSSKYFNLQATMEASDITSFFFVVVVRSRK